jgi:hypothetical protein
MPVQSRLNGASPFFRRTSCQLVLSCQDKWATYPTKKRGRSSGNRPSRSPNQEQTSFPFRERDVRGRRGSSPAQSFGSLATVNPKGEGPRLCVPASQRVCPFEEERRWNSGTTRRPTPDGRHQSWRCRLLLKGRLFFNPWQMAQFLTKEGQRQGFHVSNARVRSPILPTRQPLPGAS